MKMNKERKERHGSEKITEKIKGGKEAMVSCKYKIGV